MAGIIDPYSYMSRLNIPKYLICATGDEFFLPDSPLFFYDELPGQNHLRMVPNAEHSLLGHQLDVTYAAASYYHRVISSTPLPEFTWSITKSNGTQGEPATITVVAKEKPTRAVMVFLFYFSKKKNIYI
jgi:PhoPQ-activated pathogenicity-related protein